MYYAGPKRKQEEEKRNWTRGSKGNEEEEDSIDRYGPGSNVLSNVHFGGGCG